MLFKSKKKDDEQSTGMEKVSSRASVRDEASKSKGKENEGATAIGNYTTGLCKCIFTRVYSHFLYTI